MRLEPLRDRLNLPILVINDSPIKQFAENEHAVGQSTLESYLRFTNRVTNGEKVTVFGYGACVISRRHMFNLAGPRPLGNSIDSMDLGFALQARCLEAVATGRVDASSCVVPVPASIDAVVASSYLDRKYPATPRP